LRGLRGRGRGGGYRGAKAKKWLRSKTRLGGGRSSPTIKRKIFQVIQGRLERGGLGGKEGPKEVRSSEGQWLYRVDRADTRDPLNTSLVLQLGGRWKGALQKDARGSITDDLYNEHLDVISWCCNFTYTQRETQGKRGTSTLCRRRAVAGPGKKVDGCRKELEEMARSV